MADFSVVDNNANYVPFGDGFLVSNADNTKFLAFDLVNGQFGIAEVAADDTVPHMITQATFDTTYTFSGGGGTAGKTMAVGDNRAWPMVVVERSVSPANDKWAFRAVDMDDDGAITFGTWREVPVPASSTPLGGTMGALRSTNLSVVTYVTTSGSAWSMWVCDVNVRTGAVGTPVQYRSGNISTEQYVTSGLVTALLDGTAMLTAVVYAPDSNDLSTVYYNWDGAAATEVYTHVQASPSGGVIQIPESRPYAYGRCITVPAYRSSNVDDVPVLDWNDGDITVFPGVQPDASGFLLLTPPMRLAFDGDSWFEIDVTELTSSTPYLYDGPMDYHLSTAIADAVIGTINPGADPDIEMMYPLLPPRGVRIEPPLVWYYTADSSYAFKSLWLAGESAPLPPPTTPAALASMGAVRLTKLRGWS